MKLTTSMTVEDFENGYWYLADLKRFADTLGVAASSRMRKNELEAAITGYLKTGRIPATITARAVKTGVRDLERGLSLGQKIEHYTSGRATKDFIAREARRQDPSVTQKSGVWYRLNRWRESQIEAGAGITYGDLVAQYLRLNRMESFEKIPHGRYVNFLAEFLRHEPRATRQNALDAWRQLKGMDVPKTYADWKAARGHV